MISSLYGDLPGTNKGSSGGGSEKKPNDLYSGAKLGTPPSGDTRPADGTRPFADGAPPAKKVDISAHPALSMMPPKKKTNPMAASLNATNIALDLMKLRAEKQQREEAKAGKTSVSTSSGSGQASSASKTSSSAAGTDAHEGSGLSHGSSGHTQSSGSDFMASIEDEYDPLKPNDYDAIMKEKQRQKSKEELDRRERDIQSSRDHDAAHEEKKSGKKSFADKMMKKMGWNEGEGLGKEGQGITAPLIAQKTDATTAKIVQANPLQRPVHAPPVKPLAAPTVNIPRPGAAAPPSRPGQNTVFTRPGAPSKVLFLTNLVGKGEVDEDLEEEIRDESSKYGTVEKVRIVEAPLLADNEAVRIFVLFKDVAEARQAHHKFNGRFFGGRTVQARFFDVGRFERDDLMPRLGE